MKKIQFNSFEDLKQVMPILERFNVEFTWDIFSKNHELHLGHVNVDHVKLALSECRVPFKIVDY
ncbi:MAG: hypothetical protein NTW14_13825 [bacterium]|nr:hypothetical protein [bacterium]